MRLLALLLAVSCGLANAAPDVPRSAPTPSVSGHPRGEAPRAIETRPATPRVVLAPRSRGEAPRSTESGPATPRAVLAPRSRGEAPRSTASRPATPRAMEPRATTPRASSPLRVDVRRVPEPRPTEIVRPGTTKGAAASSKDGASFCAEWGSYWVCEYDAPWWLYNGGPCFQVDVFPPAPYDALLQIEGEPPRP